MSQYVETPCRTFQAGGVIEQFARVKLTAGKLAVCGADELGIGTIEIPALAADQYCPVRLWNAQGTRKIVAADAVTQYAEVYGAAAGRFDDIPSMARGGIALDAASGAGSIIELLPQTQDYAPELS